MDTRLLRQFRVIVRCGGLVRAAKELHLTASALSHGLKALEQEMGCRLFERVGNRLVINQAGEHLLSAIEGPMQALEDAAASVKQLSHWGEKRLRVGITASACQHLLPSVLRELRREHDGLLLFVETGDMPNLADQLREQRLDLALGVQTDDAPDLAVHPLFDDELMFVVPSRHPWADGRLITRDDVCSQALILYKRTSPSGRMVMQHLQGNRMEPRMVMEVGSVSAIKEMVRLSLGVSVLAPWVVDAELTRGTLVMRPLGARPLRRRWVISHLRNRRLSVVEERFSRLCRVHSTGLRKDRSELPATK